RRREAEDDHRTCEGRDRQPRDRVAREDSTPGEDDGREERRRDERSLTIGREPPPERTPSATRRRIRGRRAQAGWVGRRTLMACMESCAATLPATSTRAGAAGASGAAATMGVPSPPPARTRVSIAPSPRNGPFRSSAIRLPPPLPKISVRS